MVSGEQALLRNLFTVPYHLFVELAGHRGVPLRHRAPKLLLGKGTQGTGRDERDAAVRQLSLLSLASLPSLKSNDRQVPIGICPRKAPCALRTASSIGGCAPSLFTIHLSKIKPRRVWGGSPTRFP